MNALKWQKSTFSGDNTGNSIELAAAADGTIKIRESDDPDTIATTTTAKLAAFIAGVKAGEFDHLI